MKTKWVLPLAGGLLGASTLLSLYLGLVTLTSGSWQHALELLTDDRWFVAPIVLGFGVQVSLFVHLRRNLHAHRGGAMTAASGSTSTAAMVACCAHHVTDVLPLLGFSGAAVFLAQYKVPFMIVGIISSVVGIGVMLRLIHRANHSYTAIPTESPFYHAGES